MGFVANLKAGRIKKVNLGQVGSEAFSSDCRNFAFKIYAKFAYINHHQTPIKTR